MPSTAITTGRPVANRTARTAAMRGPKAAPRNAISDVRRYIPLTAQTDATQFPQYEHQEYPKMMLATVTDEKGTREVPYIDPDTNEPVIVQDEDEEIEFREANPEAVQTPINSSALNSSERAELAELRRLRAGTEDEPVEETSAEQSGGSLAALTRPNKKKPQQLKSRNGDPLPKNLD